MSLFARAGAWASLAEYAAERLTRPAVDVAAMDRDLERMLMGSRLQRVALGAGGLFDSAWSESRTRRVAHRVLHHWTVMTKTQQFRSVGCTLAAAGTTVLAAQALKPVPVGPLSWIVPLGLIVGGSVLTAAAALAARRVARQG